MDATDDLKFFFSQMAATVVGLTFFAFGVTNLLGMTMTPMQEVSFLLKPAGLGAAFERAYWIMLVVNGVWLILFIWARAAAAAALLLIGFKYALVQGWLSGMLS